MSIEDNYFIVSPFIGETWEFGISHEDYLRLTAAQSFLVEYVRFEETALQVLYAFQEFEKFIVESALEHSLFPLSPHEFAQDHRIRANIRVLSFLNSISSFRDQFPKFKTASRVSLRKEFSSDWRVLQQKSPAFGFCERLRNFAQHHYQPVSFATVGGAWDEDHEFREHRASLYAAVDEVLNNRDTPQAERDRYSKAFGQTADISLIFRETMACIGKLVREYRAKLDVDFRDALSCYRRHLIPISDLSEGQAFGHLITREGDREIIHFDVFTEFLDYAEKLRATFYSQNNGSQYVSGRAFGHR